MPKVSLWCDLPLKINSPAMRSTNPSQIQWWNHWGAVGSRSQKFEIWKIFQNWFGVFKKSVQRKVFFSVKSWLMVYKTLSAWEKANTDRKKPKHEQNAGLRYPKFTQNRLILVKSNGKTIGIWCMSMAGINRYFLKFAATWSHSFLGDELADRKTPVTKVLNLHSTVVFQFLKELLAIQMPKVSLWCDLLWK